MKIIYITIFIVFISLCHATPGGELVLVSSKNQLYFLNKHEKKLISQVKQELLPILTEEYTHFIPRGPAQKTTEIYFDQISKLLLSNKIEFLQPYTKKSESPKCHSLVDEYYYLLKRFFPKFIHNDFHRRFNNNQSIQFIIKKNMKKIIKNYFNLKHNLTLKNDKKLSAKDHLKSIIPPFFSTDIWKVVFDHLDFKSLKKLRLTSSVFRDVIDNIFIQQHYKPQFATLNFDPKAMVYCKDINALGFDFKEISPNEFIDNMYLLSFGTTLRELKSLSLNHFTMSAISLKLILRHLHKLSHIKIHCSYSNTNGDIYDIVYVLFENIKRSEQPIKSIVIRNDPPNFGAQQQPNTKMITSKRLRVSKLFHEILRDKKFQQIKTFKCDGLEIDYSLFFEFISKGYLNNIESIKLSSESQIEKFLAAICLGQAPFLQRINLQEMSTYSDELGASWLFCALQADKLPLLHEIGKISPYLSHFLFPLFLKNKYPCLTIINSLSLSTDICWNKLTMESLPLLTRIHFKDKNIDSQVVRNFLKNGGWIFLKRR